MKYQSINEIEKFSFEDCRISKFEVKEDRIQLELEALIVKPDNSQNTNYTESYAGTTNARFIGGKILSGIKEGYRYYDANDVLLKETPDEPLTMEQILKLIRACAGAYLFLMEKKTETDGLYCYSLGIELVDSSEEVDVMSDSYQLEISFEKAIFDWEFYMNRVQR